MRDTPVRKSPCLHCGAMLDMALAPDHDAVPNPGDATICLDCGHIMIFGKKMRLRNPTRAEQIKIAGDPRLIRYQNAISIVKRKREQEGKSESKH